MSVLPVIAVATLREMSFLEGRKMTTGLGCCERPFVGALAFGLLAFSLSAQGQEIRWQPVATDGDVVCMPGSGDCGDTEIKLASGGATVTLFLEMSGWDTVSEYSLSHFRGSVSSDGILGSGCPLLAVGAPDMGLEGAFQAVKVCTNAPYGCGEQNLLSVCSGVSQCEAGQLCLDRCDYVFYAMDSSCIVSTASQDYVWVCSSTGCKVDPGDGSRFYGGTLVLEVPSCAAGTYTVNFVDNTDFTVLGSCAGPPVPGLEFKPAEITIQAAGTGIPTVSEWGLIGMTLLALTAGTIVFGRRRRAAAG